MIVNLELMVSPLTDEEMALKIKGMVNSLADDYEAAQYGLWKLGKIAIDSSS